MNALPNDVVELQREIYLCVTLMLRVAGWEIDAATPHEIVEKFCEMYQQEYRATLTGRESWHATRLFPAPFI